MNYKRVKSGYDNLTFEDYTGRELANLRLLKNAQEGFSTIKNIFLLVFTISFIALFSLNNRITVSLCIFVIISIIIYIFLSGILKDNLKITRRNNIIILFLSMTFILWGLCEKKNVSFFDIDNIYLQLLVPAILGFLINIIFSMYFYKKIFMVIANKIDKNYKFEFKSKWSSISRIKFFTTITYVMADLFKHELDILTKTVHEEDYNLNTGIFDSTTNNRVKIELIMISRFYKQYLILFYNWFNVIKVIIFSLIIGGLIGYTGFYINIIIFFFVFHFLSRTIEIFFAFYKDIVRVDSKTFYKRTVRKQANCNYVEYEPIYINGWKNSAIRKPMRVSLAIHSIVEVIMSFMILYYFASLLSTIYPINFGVKIDNYNFSEYINLFLYSTSVSFFNTSFPDKDILLSLLHIWQLLISIVLISLSIATYIGKDDIITDREAEYYFYLDNKKGIKHPKEIMLEKETMKSNE